MTGKNTARTLWRIFFGLLLVGLYYWAGAKSPTQYGDPDRYYHISLSRWAVETGSWAPKTFPAVAGLGWQNYFPDKELLFHLFTYTGYFFGGEWGVFLGSMAVALLLLSVMYWHASARLPYWAAAMLTFLVFFAPVVFYRFLLVRAFVTGSLCLLLLHLGLLQRRKALTALGAFLFALAYHAYYLPVICLGLAGFLAWVERDRWRTTLNVVGAGLGGLVVGIVVNPYFPANLMVGYQHARVPSLMQGDLAKVGFGAELYPVSTDYLFYQLGPFLFILLAGVIALGRAGWRRVSGDRHYQLFYLVLISLFFAALTFQSPRASEYLVPATGLLAVILLASWMKARPRWAGIALSLAFLLGASHYAWSYQTQTKQKASDWVDQIAKVLKALPSDSSASPFIFNCEWDLSPYIIYHLPNARVVDILDPSFLYFADRDAFRARQGFTDGNVADPHGLMRDGFKADYVFCNRPLPVNKMYFDPGFQLLYPNAETRLSKDSLNPSLFRVLKGEIPQYVREMEIQWLTGVTIGNFASFTPTSPAAGPKRSVGVAPGAFLNFSQYFREERLASELGPEAAYCAVAKPSAGELKRLRGADYLVFGGGRNTRIWRNGRLLYRSSRSFPVAASAHTVLPLASPLTEKDDLALVVCSKEDAIYWGLALSFWTKREYEEKCRWKREFVGPLTTDESLSRYTEASPESCLGEWAQPPVPAELEGLADSLRAGSRPEQ